MTWVGALVALAPGCFYSFDNPVQKQPGGSISGDVVLVAPVAGQTTAGGTVTVLWSGGYTATLDATGKFVFLGLPDGTYSLSYLVPPAAVNDAPLVGLRPGVELPYTENQVDALDLGDILVGAAATVSGTVSGATGTAVVAAFAPGDAGLGVYEGYSTTTDATGHYALSLPAGNHVLAASDPAQSALAPVALSAAQSLAQDFTLGAVLGASSLQGNLVLGGPGFGAQATGAGLTALLAQVQYVAVDATGALVADGGLFATPDPLSGVGAPFNVVLPAGRTLTVSLSLPASVSFANGDPLGGLSLNGIATVAAQATTLGQVTWLPAALFDGGSGVGHSGSAIVSTLAGAGSALPDAGFVLLEGLACGAGTLYLADNSTDQVRALDLDAGTLATLAGDGQSAELDGLGQRAAFDGPRGLAVDDGGNAFVADYSSGCLRKITAAGQVSTLACPDAGIPLSSPWGVALNGTGDLYVSEPKTHVILKFDRDGGTAIFAGQLGQSGSQNGLGSQATFDEPYGLAFDGQGTLFVADAFNNAIRAIDPSGNVTTYAGDGGPGFVDGQGGAAYFDTPIGLAIDGAGNVYVSDNQNYAVRRIDAQHNVTTIAGNGSPAATDGVGLAASFSGPEGLALDAFGHLFVADGALLRQVALP